MTSSSGVTFFQPSQITFSTAFSSLKIEMAGKNFEKNFLARK
jgi:hypothetical protein